MEDNKTRSVSWLNNYIKNIVGSDPLLRDIVIKGEVSNCKYHSMGHIYFTLKDDTSSVPAVMFKGNTINGLNFRMENGQTVYVRGWVDVYERDGRYQLYAKKIVQDEGTKGKLFEQFEKLKEKLNAEGLFEFELKKEIPAFPKQIGIISAETGAAIQDIINVSRRRNPYVQLILYPAKVQGEGAAETVIQGIKKLDVMGLDTIIIARGGGSMEDLWAFNDEALARTIFNAATPIITGIGHEIDFTIADYVSDRRAPTPSAAAEIAVPDVMTTVRRVRTLRDGMSRAMKAKVDQTKMRLQNMKLRLDKQSPERLLADRIQYLAGLSDRMRILMDNKYRNYFNRFEVQRSRLTALNPTAKLTGGFGYVEANGKPLTSVRDVKVGDKISITVHDGNINTVVE